jgi:hypothetical protein
MKAVPLICVIVVNRNAFARRDADPPRKSLRPQAHVAAKLSAAGAIWESAGTIGKRAKRLACDVKETLLAVPGRSRHYSAPNSL